MCNACMKEDGEERVLNLLIHVPFQLKTVMPY